MQYIFEGFSLVNNLISLFHSRRKALLCCLLFLLTYIRVLGQDCSCPPITTCGCEVGLTKLTVEYTGLLGLTVIVEDEGGIIHGGLLLAKGSTFDIESSAGVDQPFVGDLITIRTTVAVLATINTSCADPVTIGTTFGDYTVIGGESVEGKPICCDVMETSRPVISGCPSDIFEFADPSICGKNVSWQIPSISDNCHVMSYTGSHNPGDFYAAGTTTLVTYTAIDDYGNKTTCSFNITVADNTPPEIINCPTDIKVSTEADDCEAVVTWKPPTSTDNCSVTTFSSSRKPGELFALGTSIVTYKASDTSGNESTCSFNVIVSDGTPPQISGCPDDVIISSEPTNCGSKVNWIPPKATDNCNGPISTISSHNPEDFLEIGTTIVEYSFTDRSGNISLCAFNVTVKDDTPPVIENCPLDIILKGENLCDAEATWTAPTATDNCGLAELISTHQPGDIFPEGTTEVIYTAKDVNGNSSTCTFRVIINNDDVPVISGCPEDITARADETRKIVVSWSPPTAENACGVVALVSSHDPGSEFLAGTTTVNYWNANDPDETILCSFNVEVIVIPESPNIDISDVITPDGDNINDKWIIGNIEKFRDNKVVVSDRWGNIIYQAVGYNNESIVWTGLINSGTQAPTGTYFYYVEASSLNGEVVRETGFIELIQ